MQPQIRVEKGGRNTLQVFTHKLLQNMGWVCVALSLVLLVPLCRSNAKLNELNRELRVEMAVLEDSRNQYDYLASKLSAKTNIKVVEEAAGTQLGLMKIDPSQITYITLESEESVITRPDGGAGANVLQEMLSWLNF